MSSQAIYLDFKEELFKKNKKAICFKTFGKNKFVINVCSLKEDVCLEKEFENLKVLMLKHGTNHVYNQPDLLEITSLNDLCNSTYKFLFSKKKIFQKKCLP